MKNMRIIIYGDEIAEAQFYETLCRDLSKERKIPIELKVYSSSDELLFDLGDTDFHERVDIVYFCLDQGNLEVPGLIRDTGYMNLIVFIGAEEVFVPYEELFDAEIYNFVQDDRSSENLERFAHIFQKADEDVMKNRAERITLSYAGEIRRIDINQIHYFEVQKHTLVVHFGDKETFTFISTLSKMENHLKGRDFIRVSRFYLISLDSVQKLTANGVIMYDDTTVPVGRKYYAEIKNALDKKASEA
ncbi:MAG: LytTR family transcriptional regulator [Oscillospiraceae bacterium]|nr:LytTR family transcriptional regulator [Oscillospiraceae bacterium]